MSSNLADLTARRVALQEQCAAERAAVADSHSIIRYQANRIDEAIESLRRLTPVLLIGGLVVTVALGPGKAFGLAKRGLRTAFYASQAFRILR